MWNELCVETSKRKRGLSQPAGSYDHPALRSNTYERTMINTCVPIRLRTEYLTAASRAPSSLSQWLSFPMPGVVSSNFTTRSEKEDVSSPTVDGSSRHSSLSMCEKKLLTSFLERPINLARWQVRIRPCSSAPVASRLPELPRSYGCGGSPSSNLPLIYSSFYRTMAPLLNSSGRVNPSRHREVAVVPTACWAITAVLVIIVSSEPAVNLNAIMRKLEKFLTLGLVDISVDWERAGLFRY